MQQSYILFEVLSLILFVIVSYAMDQPLSWLFVHSVLTFCLMFGLRDQSPTASEKEVQNVRLYTTLSLSLSLSLLFKTINHTGRAITRVAEGRAVYAQRLIVLFPQAHDVHPASVRAITNHHECLFCY
jgi:hypothetical protein